MTPPQIRVIAPHLGPAKNLRVQKVQSEFAQQHAGDQTRHGQDYFYLQHPGIPLRFPARLNGKLAVAIFSVNRINIAGHTTSIYI